MIVSDLKVGGGNGFATNSAEVFPSPAISTVIQFQLETMYRKKTLSNRYQVTQCHAFRRSVDLRKAFDPNAVSAVRAVASRLAQGGCIGHCPALSTLARPANVSLS